MIVDDFSVSINKHQPASVWNRVDESIVADLTIIPTPLYFKNFIFDLSYVSGYSFVRIARLKISSIKLQRENKGKWSKRKWKFYSDETGDLHFAATLNYSLY